MNKCIDSIGLIGQKEQFEQLLRQWQDSTGLFKSQLDFQRLKRLYEKRLEIDKALMYFTETFRRTDELSTRAMFVHNGANPIGSGKRQYITIKDNREKWDADTDREILGTLLKNYRTRMVNEAYLPDFFKTIDDEFNGDCQKYADALYAKSKLMKRKTRLYPNKKSFGKDLGVKYGLDLTEVLGNLRESYRALEDSIGPLERYLCAAKLRMEEDMPHYSDANFTMRLSYGQVKEYNLGGRPSGFQTMAPSIVEKMKRGDSIEDYKVQPEMVDLMSAAGDMPLCFLTTNDITGGNSGSPMFDSKNRLIGLAFDGNWDSLSSDIFFDSHLARCIGVDIRYILYMMDKWGHADRLLNEMDVQ